MKRPSRARKKIAWDSIFAELATGAYVEIQRPPHLTMLQMRDVLVAVAAMRGVALEYSLVAGKLLAWVTLV